MNPYSAPKSELNNPRGPLPDKIKVVLLLIFISGVAAAVGVYLYSFTDEGLALTDPVMIGVNFFWLCVLLWLANTVVRSRENPKNIFLVIALVIFGFAVFDRESEMIFLTELVESMCFAGSYLVLRVKSLEAWFRP